MLVLSLITNLNLVDHWLYHHILGSKFYHMTLFQMSIFQNICHWMTFFF